MRALLRLFVVAVVFFPLTAYATEVSGYQWGTWTRENSPYNVVGKIRVPPESTLVIEPGVVVNFQGYYKFIVDSAATLLAVGTETDSIYFTTADTATGWHGIRFRGASPDCRISYSRLEYGKATGSWPHPDAGGGAICCYYSSPIISDNTIINNWAEIVGGGIYCTHSSPEISNNTIRDNWASSNGGGIDCHHDSNPTISGNSIIGNSANANGGGINCRNSDPMIIGNIISGNSASGGGGICCCYWSHPTISNNTISGNSVGSGGGILCWHSSNPLIIDNTISGNSASRKGGAIYLDRSAPTVTGNTITGNSDSPGGGGGVYCYESNPRITNTILWEDTAPEIGLYRSSPKVTYCDVQGGWPGTGNIDADPLFVGPFNDDLHLRWHSPCINAGDPSLTDPDGTRSDIGAFYFNLAVLGIVEVYPHDEPIVIPPQGGDITYDGGVLNLSRGNLTVDIWAQAFVPELPRPYRLWRYNDVTIPFADSIIRADLLEHVPGYAPSGDYAFVTYIGDFPSSIIDSSCLYFGKEGAIYSSAEGDDWQTLKGWFNSRSELSEATLPTHYSLSQNYPNPFNATAIINFQLPVDGYVKLEVYNLFGQKVATLVDGSQGAGYKSVGWDASSVSSGLYFYRLSAGDYTETRRMMLVK